LNGNGQLNPPYISDNCAGGGTNNENDFCVALRLDYNNFQFFAAGDLSGYNSSSYSDIETSIGADCGDVEVYLVDHHGSRTSSNPSFLSALDPEVSILSLGANSYGHPHTEAMQRLLATSTVYETEDSLGNVVYGDIVITTTGFNNFLVEGDSYPLPQGGQSDTIAIADIQNNYGNYAGQSVIVKGVITLGAGVTNPYITDAYIEDSSGKGINLFATNVLSGITFGNEVSLRGTVDQNAGTTQLVNITDITVHDIKRYVGDTPFSTGAAKNIAWEGTRMWVGGVASAKVDYGTYQVITINDGSGSLDLYISDYTGANITSYVVGDFVNAYGVCDVNISGPDTTYQIIVGYQPDISRSSYTVKMLPENPPIEVVSTGGFFEFTGILRNNSAVSQIVDVWIMLKLPNGASYGPLMQLNNIPIGPNQMFSAPNTRQNVPSGAPLGDYYYWVYAGDYPSVKSDSNAFPFRIVPAMNAHDDIGVDEFVASGWGIDEMNFSACAITGGEEQGGCPGGETANAGEPAGLQISNSPNPFNASTTIHYAISKDANIRLSIYNLLGQEVATIVDEQLVAGDHSVIWDASNYSSGIYFYRLTAGGKVITKRMTLLK